MHALNSAIQAVRILSSVCLGSAKPQQAAKGLMDALRIVLQVGGGIRNQALSLASLG